LVVATRVNPNGVDPATRCIQVRAWNREVEAPANSEEAAVELVAAHLFGLLIGIGLRASARAISFRVLTRSAKSERSPQFWAQDDAHLLVDRADEENERLLRPLGQDHANYKLASPIETSAGPVRATLASALVRLIKSFSHTDALETLSAALMDADKELDDWQTSRFKDSGENETDTILQCGLRLSFPPEFDREDKSRT